MRLAAGLRPDPLGKLERSPDPLAAIEGCLLLSGREGNGMEKGKEGDGKGEKRKGRGKGRTPVPDCESAKVATLKVWGSANYAWGE